MAPLIGIVQALMIGVSTLRLTLRPARHLWHAGIIAILLLLSLPAYVAVATEISQVKTITLDDDTFFATLVSQPNAVIAPVTVQTRVRFGNEVRGSDDGVWLAGLSAEVDGPPTALSLTFGQVSAGWLGPMWGLQLQSDAGLLPGRLAPQKGSGFLHNAEFILLQSSAPRWGHEYEASLGYDPSTGATSILLVDVTANEILLARNLQLLPYEAPLYVVAGAGQLKGNRTDQKSEPIAVIAELKTSDHVVPVRVSWWLMQRPTPEQQYLSVRQIDRRKDTALSVHFPWQNPRGELAMTLLDEAGEQALVVPYVASEEYTAFTVTSLPPGAYTAILQYLEDGLAWELDQRQLMVGVIEVDVKHLNATPVGGDIILLDGVLRVASDGPIGDVSVGLNASVVHHAFMYDALRGQGTLRKDSFEATTVMGPVAVAVYPEAEVEFTAEMRIPVGAQQASLWELQIEPFSSPASFFADGVSYHTWLGEEPNDEAWHGFLQNEHATRLSLAPGVDVVSLRGRIPAGPVEMHLVIADVTQPGVTVDALVGQALTTPASSRWPRSQPSQMVEATGAVAGVNAAFFDISDTMNPLGIVMRSGELMKSEWGGFDAAIGVTADGTPYLGFWQWVGGVQKPGGIAYRPAVGLNVTSPGAGLAVFRSPATRTVGTTNANSPLVELVLAELPESTLDAGPWGRVTTRVMRGIVQEVRQGQPSIPLRDGIMVLSGGGENGEYLLETFKVGDVVEIPWRLTGRTEWPYMSDWRDLYGAVSGGVVLLRNGQYGEGAVTTNRERHPRTAVGMSWDQTRLYILVVDGRSSQSVGMTYHEMADFFRYMGAFHALNLDGGGSTGLAVKDPRFQRVNVLNVPSDGRQRYVPDGIGIFYTEPEVELVQ